MKPILAATFICAATCLYGEKPAEAQRSPASSSEAAPPARAEPKRIIHGGRTFQLANSTAAKNVETDEYILEGESIAAWTELLTVQRLTLPKAGGVGEFLSYFRSRVEEDKASLELVREGRSASVFAVRFPQTEQNDEQVMICLAFVDPVQSGRLNIVQFAIKPARTDVAEVEKQITSWRDKFIGQVQSMARD